MSIGSVPARGTTPTVAAVLMAGSAAAAAVDAVIVRLVAEEMHVFQIAFFRNAFGLLPVMLFLAATGQSLNLASRHWPTHVVRAALKLGAMIAYFLALLNLPLAVAMALVFTTPFFASAGSMLLLGERVSPWRVASLAIGLAGVVIILEPGGTPIGQGAVLALLSAAGLGAVSILMKVSSGREPAGRIVWLNLAVATPMALLIAIPVWETPSAFVLSLLLLQGILGAAAQLMVARAMALADAAAIVPIDFIRLPLIMVLGFAFFGEVPGWPLYLGGTVIIAGVLVHLRAERNRRALPVSLPKTRR